MDFKPRVYILDGHKAVPASNMAQWAEWMEEHWRDCVVAIDQVGDYEVHTAFLGLDHNFSGDLPTMLFETMVFGGYERADGVKACERCSTWEQAEEQHQAMVSKFRVAVYS